MEDYTEINTEETGKKKGKEKSLRREVVEMGLYLIGVLILTWLLVNFVGQRTLVNGSSMEATLQDGDNLITDKISYRFKDPERFDIIVFPYHYGDNPNYIKRIIGLPGETVRIEDGTIYINGEILEENYGAEVMENSGVASEDIVLADDEYFVLGDNRNRSMDSREASVGNIKREDIIGRAWLRVWPLNGFGILKHQ